MALDMEQWKYPALAKQESDGIFCYQVQRRVSAWISVRLASWMGANTATGLDLIFGVAAAVLVLLDHWLWGVVLVQAFGIFSCVDGEIARIQGSASRIGDFLDTLTDRCTELLLVAAKLPRMRQLLLAMGGDMSVHSGDRDGTTLTCYLPVRPALPVLPAEPALPVQPAPSLPSGRDAPRTASASERPPPASIPFATK